MLKQMQTQRRADSRPPLPHQDEFPAEYSLARLLSSRAGLRFLCYAHPQLEINRWLLFFGQRQLSPNSTVSSHDAGQGSKGKLGGTTHTWSRAESAERSGGLQRSEGWGMTCLREEAAPP
jgi:hypothetical protein